MQSRRTITSGAEATPIETPSVPRHGARAGGPESGPEFRTPYPGHSLFQDCFFVCDVKGVASRGHLGRLYVQVVVDANCGLAFAKVYPSEQPANAVDIIESQVLPFYRRYGVPVERIVTPSTREFTGQPLVHAFETLLAVSHIDHLHMGLGPDAHSPLCEQFYHTLAKEFFAPALRRTYDVSFGKLQQELDAFVETYNHLPEGNTRLDAFERAIGNLPGANSSVLSGDSTDRG
jgi:hypothetical protein